MNWDGLVTIGILLVIIILIYSKMKNQTLRDTIQEIKDLFIHKEG